MKSITSISLVFLVLFCDIYGFKIPKRYQTLVISFDGTNSAKFDEFLKINPNANFHEIINNGVKADYMIPSFPTLTFPNHYTLVTGLNIESHGVVGNTFYDPLNDRRVGLISDDKSISNDVKWWNKGEPVWLTAKNQGLKTGSFFWTGSEVLTRTPDFWLTFDNTFPDRLRIDDVVNWLYKFKMDLAFLYFDEPDHEGHSVGVDAPEYMDKIKQCDDNLGYLIKNLKEKGIYEDINIIILSDHGMATMKNNSKILIQDFVKRTLINSTRTVYGVTTNLHPIPGFEEEVYNGLKKIPNARVYYKEEIPEDLFYSKSERIGPIIVLCDEGYILSDNVANQPLKGNHGFDNKYESMRTIFLARGPNFKKNVKLSPFKNVNVYPLICELTQIVCKPHNGSISTFDDVLIQIEEITTTTSNKSNINTFNLFTILFTIFF